MMNIFRQYQSAITFIIVVGVLYAGYQFFFASPTEDALTVTEVQGAGPDQDLIALLFELKSIRLDNSIFGDPLFQSLNDFGQELVQEPVGRQNPFAPLGAPAATPTTNPR